MCLFADVVCMCVTSMLTMLIHFAGFVHTRTYMATHTHDHTRMIRATTYDIRLMFTTLADCGVCASSLSF